MKRILVIGCSGAGKSVLARELSRRLELPLIHLDRHWWLPGWRERSREDFDRELESILKQESWILDGNFARTFSRRLEFADTVVWLRLPRRLCLWGVFRRFLRFHGRTRPDLGKECPEKIDLPFLKYIWNYDKSTRPRMEEMLKKRPASCTLIELASRRDVKLFLEDA